MKKRGCAAAAALLYLLLAGCGAAGPSASTVTSAKTEAQAETTQAQETTATQMETLSAALSADKEEGNCRTGYEIFVRSFYDSNGDGIGDLAGVEEKLPYIADTMGFDEIWLMPICPSPSYHKYDVTDYEDVDSEYGTLADYESLVKGCHERGVTVLNDLVLNHTSSEHPWFLAAQKYLESLPAGEEPDPSVCPYVDYYNFSDTAQDGYAALPGTDWFYEARFSDSMPDLNLDSEAVRGEISDIVRFWLNEGADGFRLDAVTSYYTESAEKTIAFLTWLNDTVKEIKPDAYLVGEAWTDQKTYASYYASGVDSFFDFAFSGSEGDVAKLARGKLSALTFGQAMEDEEALYASVNPDYVNAPFYTNHDMARSAGYFTQDADGSKTKFAGALNLLQQGNAFVYYGEELGMKGSGKDENKRAPMYWSADADEAGMCDPPPGMDSFDMKFPSEEEQAEDPLSIRNYFQAAVRIRNAFGALRSGDTKVFSDLSDHDVLVFSRTDADHSTTPVLVAVNAGDEETQVDLAGEGAFFDTLSAVLTVDAQEVDLSGTVLTLPAHAMAFLTGQ